MGPYEFCEDLPGKERAYKCLQQKEIHILVSFESGSMCPINSSAFPGG